MDSQSTQVANWQDVCSRSPRPGFFLGDDGASRQLRNSNVLLDNALLPVSYDLGRLGKLPLELLHQIVGELAEDDIPSLVALRNVNRGMATVVHAWRDFATVAAFPRALAAIARLTPYGSPSVSLHKLAQSIWSSSCASCLATTGTDNYGDYLYLLTPERVCYSCFRSRLDFLPIAQTTSGTSAPQSNHTMTSPSSSAQPHPQLTGLRVNAGRYGVLARLAQPTVLYDRRQVQELCPDFGSRVQISTRTSSNPKEHLLKSCTRQFRPDPLRYAVVIPAPYWDEETESFERGYSCAACEFAHGSLGWADPVTRYTSEGIRKHVEDPRFGGRVVAHHHPSGRVTYEHDSPRTNFHRVKPEFGASVDLARRYEALEVSIVC